MLIHRLIEMRTIESRSAIMLSTPRLRPASLGWKMKLHLDETYGQIENLEKCLALLGLDHAPVLNVPSDPCLDCISLYVWKHLEIAHYLGLIVLAEEEEKDMIATLLRQNLGQDSAMAHWLQGEIAHTGKAKPGIPPFTGEALPYGQYQ